MRRVAGGITTIRVYLALLKISTFEKIVFFSSTLRHSALLEEFRSTIEEGQHFSSDTPKVLALEVLRWNGNKTHCLVLRTKSRRLNLRKPPIHQPIEHSERSLLMYFELDRSS